MTKNSELEKSGRGVFWDNLSGLFQESQEEIVTKDDTANINHPRYLANTRQCKPFNRRIWFVGLIIWFVNWLKINSRELQHIWISENGNKQTGGSILESISAA